MTKAYSYLRFSTPEQMKGDSFRRQARLAEDYCRTHGLTLDTKTSYHDLGTSAYRGKNVEAGRLGEFREAVQTGLIAKGSVLLVESLDRISRQTARKAVRILEDIVEAGVDVVTLSDGKRYTEASLDGFEFLFAIIIFIRANEESLMKARRLKAAWDAKRAKVKDKPLTSISPAWLRLNRDENRFEGIPERVEVIKRIFAMILEGVGQHQVAYRLNQEGVPVFGRGKHWHRSYIVKILHNPAVIGTYTPHIMAHEDGKVSRLPQEPVENYFPAVVSREDFEAVQEAMRGRIGGRTMMKGATPNALAGLVRCGLCGSAMTRVNKGRKGVVSYVCSQAKMGLGCQYHSVRQRDIAEAITRNGSKIASEYPDADAKVEARFRELEEQVNAIDQEISGVIDLLITTPSEALKERLARTEEAKAEIVKEMSSLSVSPVPLPRETALEELAGGLVNSKVLRTLFDGVVVHPHQGTLGMQWRNDGTTEVMFRWPKEEE